MSKNIPTKKSPQWLKLMKAEEEERKRRKQMEVKDLIALKEDFGQKRGKEEDEDEDAPTVYQNIKGNSYPMIEHLLTNIYIPSKYNEEAATRELKIVPKDDMWAFQHIGAPFPENPVKVVNEQNMYVALWYKHGKPIFGRAWNNGGLMECSFLYLKTELTGAKDLGGQIQILQYKGDHNTLGYWYEWIKYKDRFENIDDRQLLKCGDSLPIYWKKRAGGPLVGFLDNKTEEAHFSHDGVVENITGKALDNMFIIVRNLKGGPHFCECKMCLHLPPYMGDRIYENWWMDIRAGDPFPARPLVKALGKPLETIKGEKKNQHVALWYQQGEPVCGRIWKQGGKVAANFGWFNNEYKANIGSIQILLELPEHVRGFDYAWKPFKEAAVFGEKEWNPVHVDHHKGDISPCVLNVEGGKQILGKVDVRNERATVAFNGKEHIFVGPTVHPFMVLCRKDRRHIKLNICQL